MIAEGGRIDTQPRGSILQRQLRLAGEHVAYLLPVLQVAGMIERNARKILERRIHQIEIVVHPADAGVRMIAGDNGIYLRRCGAKEKREMQRQ